VKDYEIIEHTADIGIRVKGPDLKELFIKAAAAMFDIIAEKKSYSEAHQQQSLTLTLNAENREELFVNWLNELLSLYAIKENIFCDFRFKFLDEHNLQAEVFGCDINDYKVNTEIKAATYHQLRIEQTGSNWEAEVIFDV